MTFKDYFGTLHIQHGSFEALVYVRRKGKVINVFYMNLNSNEIYWSKSHPRLNEFDVKFATYAIK